MTILCYINEKECCLSVKVKNILKRLGRRLSILICLLLDDTVMHLLYFLLLKILRVLILPLNKSFKITLAYWDGK